jgi:pyrroloquinoline quinone biosynthesis protein B
MQVRILGAAAGGGSPQWNCNCRVCLAARAPGTRVTPRTQSSIAVQGRDERWFLINASPDLRAQLAYLPRPVADGLRSMPVAGVLLTDAEIDHTAGLLLLREAATALPVYSTAAVRTALAEGYPILRMLESYCGVQWNELRPGSSFELAGSGLDVDVFDVGGDAPLYMGAEASEPGAIGLTITDAASGKVLTYVPGLAALDEAIVARFERSDCVLVDGTFWQDDELVQLGVSARRAADMGHLPLGPPSGTLPLLGSLRARTILVHINNTNPILLDDSPERAAVDAASVEVAFDGMEIDLS